MGPLRGRRLAGLSPTHLNISPISKHALQSLNTGPPPSFSLAYIDCSYPQYGADEGGFGTACEFHFLQSIRGLTCPPLVEIWQCRFAAECVADVTARTLTAEAPSYATIMDLDRKVREFPLPEGMAAASSEDLSASFQRCVLDHIRETGTRMLSIFDIWIYSNGCKQYSCISTEASSRKRL